MSKMVNLLSILWLLDSGNTYTAREIAERLEVSERTVYRYMDALAMSGYPIISKAGNEGGYSLLKKSETSFTLTADDRLSVLMAQDIFDILGLENRNLEHFIEKMNQYNNDKLQAYLNDNKIIEIIGNPEVVDMNTIYELSLAIRNKNRVKIVYNASLNHRSDRIIEPYKIPYWNYKWYLIAYCHLRSDYRIFRMDKIHKYEILSEIFSPNLAFEPVNYFNKKMTPVNDESVELTSLIIEGGEWAIQKLKEHWFLSNYIIEANENRIIFKLENYIITNYLPNILLPFSNSIKIIEPASFRNDFVLYLEDIIKTHKNK